MIPTVEKLNVIRFHDIRGELEGHRVTTENLMAHQSGTYMSGYGDVSGVIIDATPGITGTINLDLTVKVVSFSKLEEWRVNIYQHLTEAERNTLEERYSGNLGGEGFFTSVFGKFAGGGDYEHYRNKSKTFISDKTEKMDGFLKGVYDLEVTEHKVSGPITIQPIGLMPARLAILFPVCKVVFNDGRTIRIINNSGIKAVDPNTNEEGATVTPNINIVPV